MQSLKFTCQTTKSQSQEIKIELHKFEQNFFTFIQIFLKLLFSKFESIFENLVQKGIAKQEDTKIRTFKNKHKKTFEYFYYQQALFSPDFLSMIF